MFSILCVSLQHVQFLKWKVRHLVTRTNIIYLHCINHLNPTLQLAAMVMFVWLVVQHPMRGGLKCAKTMNGVQFVTAAGTPLMLKWSADNSDMIREVHILIISQTNNYVHLILLISTQTGVRGYYSAYFGQGVGSIHLTSVRCTGTEFLLLGCPYSIPSASSCNHYSDAGVRCSGKVHIECENTYCSLTKCAQR